MDSGNRLAGMLEMVVGDSAGYAALTKYEVFHIFGLKISYPVVLILAALLVSAITLPFAYMAFHKHQVA